MSSGSRGASEQTDLRRRVAALMHEAWREPGFAVPNADTYPHQWLWDSCFHAVIWASLDAGPAVTEVASALALQADDGFVPHMIYWHDPDLHADFWGRPRASTITQPPMYGHAVAEMVRRGYPVPADVVARARAGLLHLGRRPRTPAGLVPVFHPWETGCDDSPRWDPWLLDGFDANGDGDLGAWRRARKADLVAALELADAGHAIGSRRFVVGSIGFNALVAWNAAELASVMPPGDGEARALTELADRVGEAVRARWSHDRWLDDQSSNGDQTTGESAGVRTADSMLALLVDPRPDAFEQLSDPEAFGAPYGPRGVHRSEATYEPDVYWRGPVWPQIGYLLVLAAARAERAPLARMLARRTIDGALRSELAEYWNPETGAGLGAIPQTWAGLALPISRFR